MTHKLTISFDEISRYAHTNLKALGRTARGIVLSFHGLNGGIKMDDSLSDWDVRLAEQGIVHLAPYDGPWSWMNDPAIALTDALVAAVHTGLPSLIGAPIISTGGSMGGLSALVYARYARITPSACAAT